MIDLIVALLVSMFPACASEDSDWCVFVREDAAIVNFEMDDPTPEGIVIHRD